nr:MAG TPA_asm: hypothetical protein [Caudoviricetes sp.]
MCHNRAKLQNIVLNRVKSVGENGSGGGGVPS